MSLCEETSSPPPPNPPPAGEDLVMKVFEKLLVEVRGEGVLSDQHLLALHALFPQQLLPALELVEDQAVTLFTCSPSPTLTRTLYHVQGTTGNHYILLSPSSPATGPSPQPPGPPGYCSCPSYVYSVLVRRDSALCKHQLAAQLAVSTGHCKTQHVSPQQWTDKAALDNNTHNTTYH